MIKFVFPQLICYSIVDVSICKLLPLLKRILVCALVQSHTTKTHTVPNTLESVEMGFNILLTSTAVVTDSYFRHVTIVKLSRIIIVAFKNLLESDVTVKSILESQYVHIVSITILIYYLGMLSISNWV